MLTSCTMKRILSQGILYTLCTRFRYFLLQAHIYRARCIHHTHARVDCSRSFSLARFLPITHSTSQNDGLGRIVYMYKHSWWYFFYLVSFVKKKCWFRCCCSGLFLLLLLEIHKIDSFPPDSRTRHWATVCAVCVQEIACAHCSQCTQNDLFITNPKRRRRNRFDSVLPFGSSSSLARSLAHLFFCSLFSFRVFFTQFISFLFFILFAVYSPRARGLCAHIPDSFSSSRFYVSLCFVVVVLVLFEFGLIRSLFYPSQICYVYMCVHMLFSFLFSHKRCECVPQLHIFSVCFRYCCWWFFESDVNIAFGKFALFDFCSFACFCSCSLSLPICISCALFVHWFVVQFCRSNLVLVATYSLF